MRRFGRAVAHTGGALVVRCEEGVEPTFDAPVYDSSLDRIGETFEFFGPVGRPYALVDGDAPTDAKLYLRDEG
jgi:rRNA processing protein Gar1